MVRWRSLGDLTWNDLDVVAKDDFIFCFRLYREM